MKTTTRLAVWAVGAGASNDNAGLGTQGVLAGAADVGQNAVDRYGRLGGEPAVNSAGGTGPQRRLSSSQRPRRTKHCLGQGKGSKRPRTNRRHRGDGHGAGGSKREEKSEEKSEGEGEAEGWQESRSTRRTTVTALYTFHGITRCRSSRDDCRRLCLNRIRGIHDGPVTACAAVSL